MECACGEHAIINEPARCKTHFLECFEKNVQETIDEFDLLSKDDRVAVAVSGGKDSLTILMLLKKFGYNVTAIAIDEGIAGYREKTLVDARRVCDDLGIPLIIRSYEELTGMTLDAMSSIRKERNADTQNSSNFVVLQKKKFHPCTVCGTLRRHLLNVAAKDFNVLATGHNADDEAQAVLMNIIKGNTEVFPRLGPSSGAGAKGFTRRVKPLYFCTEKEVMTFAFLNGLVAEFTECPNVDESYRHLVRDELNSYAQSHHGVKKRILERFLVAKEAFPTKEIELQRCDGCGEPSSNAKCRACIYTEMLAKN